MARESGPSPGTAAFELERLRQKLLNLTTSNRLLHYPVTRASARVIRIVDELPDAVHATLVLNGKDMVLSPTPGDADPPADESIDAKVAETALELSTGSVNSQTLFVAEDESEEAVAEETATEVALPDLSPDLPEPPADLEDAAERHRDRYLQTDMPSEKLEARLRKMTADANSSVEETGINILHLAFGFLEWYETEDPNVRRLAPLVLVPVHLQRDKVVIDTDCYAYKVIYEGEDIQQNISLAEKLKQDFSLALPELDPDQGPEAYFNQVRDAIRSQPRWRVLRQMVLGFFQFSKLRMYLDLDPAKWPTASPISGHMIVKDLIEGKESPDPLPFGEEKEYNPNASLDQIPLVVDADGSQHRALAAAFAGKNLVIEGPPGTGKSQTITNLIAGAIARGKTVLFVAEKLAALEVVRRNLDRAGLGGFCLELHSRKANKRALLDDLHRRLKSRFVPPHDWQVHSKNLVDAQEKLEKLSALLTETQPYLEEPVWQLLWRTNHLREKFRDRPPVALSGTEAWTSSDISRRMEYFEDLAQHHRQSEADGAHPWAHIYATRLMPTDVENSFASLSQLVSSLEKIDREWHAFKEEQGGHLANSLKGLVEFAGQVRMLTSPAFAREFARLIPAFKHPQLIEKVNQLAKAIDAHRILSTTAGKCLAGDLATLDLPALVGAIDSAALNIGSEVRWKDLSRLELSARAAASELKRVLDWIGGVQIKDMRVPVTLADTLKLIQILEMARTAPVEILKHPWAGHLSERAPALVEEAKNAVSAHVEVRTELQKVFHFPGLPTRDEIVRLLAIYRRHEHRFLRFLSAEYRQARRATARFLKGTVPKESLTPWLERLEKWLNRDQELTIEADWCEVLGPLYKGARTPWAALEAMIAWCGNLAKTCGDASFATWALDNIGIISNVDVTNPLASSTKADSLIKDQVSKAAPLLGKSNSIGLTSLVDRLRGLADGISSLLRLSKGASVVDDVTLPNLKDALGAYSKLAGVKGMIQAFTSDFGDLHQGTKTDTSQLRMVHDWVDHILGSPLPTQTKDWLLQSDGISRFGRLRKFVSSIDEGFKETQAVTVELKRWFDFEVPPSHRDLEAAADPLETEPLRALLDRLNSAIGAPELLPHWAEYCRERPEGFKLGLAPLIRALEEGRVPTSEPGEFFIHCVYSKASRDLMMTNGNLPRFTRPTIEGALERFRTRDRELLTKSSKRLAALTSERMVPFGNGRGPVGSWSEQALIEREIAKRRKHIPIRQLLQRSGDAITSLKPCFMMSPLSVAQFLAPGDRTFDLVVMDEASQLRPEDSLGAIARGKQIVVVGDPKQLPPTSFFDRLMDIDIDDEEEGVTDDTESILDLCLRAYRPACNLKWHYRSKHESLIAFSNSQFYDHELLLFPSSSRDPGEMGIRHHLIKGGTFAGRKNLAEAQAVVAAIIDHGRREPRSSLGVVAFNGPQRDLIQELLEEAGKKDFSAARAVEALGKGSEPLFIKNLENVQGDERDVIFISYTYGADPDAGKVHQRFGPINGQNGWRRLNVLITRAKKRVEVFTSMKSEDIHAASGHRGVEAMRAYLEYAETGRWRDPGKVSEKEPDSDFEVMVASILERHGYRCLPQVGVAGFFIDIGVVHPDRSDEFILGVECDGATYHSNRCVRDRDRLRQEILESRGWRIHRVWSTDWWMNPDAEVKRLIASIEQARKV